MTTPLTVVLDGPDGFLTLTRAAADLTFKSLDPGGFAGATISLKRPMTQELLAPYSDVYVYDGTTAEHVGGGRLLEQGRTVDESGEIWALTALGEGFGSFTDVRKPLFYIDADLTNWYMAKRTTRRVEASATVIPDSSVDDTVLYMSASDGQNVPTDAEVLMLNRVPDLCGQTIGGIGYRRRSGRSDADWRTRCVLYTNAALAGAINLASDNWATGTAARQLFTTNGSFSSNTRRVAGFQWVYASSGATASESYWSAVRDVIIQAQLYGRDGALRTTGYTNEWFRLGELFIDLCARFAPRLNIAEASVATGVHQFDQLTWLAGVNAQDVLNELLEIENGYTWGVYDRNPDTGLFRTSLFAYPTTIRYYATVDHGADMPSPASELFDHVYVTWNSPSGRPQVTRVPSTPGTYASNPQLEARGLHRGDTIALESEAGSTVNATKAGQAFLADHGVIPNGGRVNIATRVYDALLGRWVQPYQIVPGYLMSLDGVHAESDVLNATSPDGVTVSRVRSMEYTQSSGIAACELDSFTITTERVIAKLANRRTRK